MAAPVVFSVTAWVCLSHLQVWGLQQINNRPIVGVVSREVSSLHKDLDVPLTNYSSFIPASYVKFLEGGGARVVPIFPHQNRSHYERLFQYINGVLLPGGSTWNDSHGYGRVGRIFYDLAMQANQQGDYFPIWGTCLGFEILAYWAAEQKDPRCSCEADNIAMPLVISKGFWDSRMFHDIPADVLTALMTEPVTVNYHTFCLTPMNFTRFGLNKKFRILSLNKDVNNLIFISVMEGIDLPMYAVQFHPEMNLYEWSLNNTAVPHSAHAARFSQFLASFFVNEARKSGHRFPDEEMEKESLIYNYPATYTGKSGSFYDQIYFFK